ncbi:hemicentin-1-like [Hyla sarda]|uniref:hemicentin-1-like n=1 Tax=Hyla sarda TaxID=327740 RepID=UPI0024C2D560|nr:hemicentin-1-like [Hyla sarda]
MAYSLPRSGPSLFAIDCAAEGTDAAITVQSDSSTNYLLGNAINLTISYTSPKDATVSWSKDGVLLATWSKGSADVADAYIGRLTITGNGSLLISNIIKGDGGDYTVRVGANGEIPGTLTWPVTIYDPVTSPSVSQSPAVVDENTPAVNLKCSADIGGMNFTWTKDGKPLTNDRGYEELDGGQILKIVLPMKNDSGIYSCNVSNPVDWKTATLELSVTGTEDNTIKVQRDSSPNFLLGENITLTITYTSTNNPTVAWFKDNAKLAQWNKGSPDVADDYIGRLEIIGNGSLLISNSTKDDGGNYTVRVEALGKVSGSLIIPVTIYDPVTNVSVSQSPAVVDENTTAVNLTCSADTEGVTYTWTKGGRSLPNDSSFVTLDGGQILQIILPKRTHGGIYVCNVSNLVHWKNATWTLNISGTDAPIDVQSNSSTIYLVGNNITLSISYTSPKDANIIWSKDGVQLADWNKGSSGVQDPNRQKIIGNGSLLISNSTKDDSGNYTVRVGAFGELPGTRIFLVTVYDPVTNPSVSQSPAKVNEKTPAVNLTCSAATGGMSYAWARDGQTLPSGGSYVALDGGHILQIVLPKKTHNGNYSCNVSNPVDWKIASWTLSVLDPVTNPSVSQSPAKVNEKTPAVNLTCSAATGGMSYAWARDGQTLPSGGSYVALDGGHILQIVLPKKTHNGNYSCNVSNPVDWKIASWTLSVSGNSHLAATVGVVIGAMLGAILFTEELWR